MTTYRLHRFKESGNSSQTPGWREPYELLA